MRTLLVALLLACAGGPTAYSSTLQQEKTISGNESPDVQIETEERLGRSYHSKSHKHRIHKDQWGTQDKSSVSSTSEDDRTGFKTNNGFENISGMKTDESMLSTNIDQGYLNNNDYSVDQSYPEINQLRAPKNTDTATSNTLTDAPVTDSQSVVPPHTDASLQPPIQDLHETKSNKSYLETNNGVSPIQGSFDTAQNKDSKWTTSSRRNPSFSSPHADFPNESKTNLFLVKGDLENPQSKDFKDSYFQSTNSVLPEPEDNVPFQVINFGKTRYMPGNQRARPSHGGFNTAYTKGVQYSYSHPDTDTERDWSTAEYYHARDKGHAVQNEDSGSSMTNTFASEEKHSEFIPDDEKMYDFDNKLSEDIENDRIHHKSALISARIGKFLTREGVPFCDPNPCRNGGSCTATSSGFLCNCASGFLGDQCQENNWCEPNPCRNGGSCHYTMAGFVCGCNEGFRGQYCEEAKKCEGSPCLNGGRCEEGEEDFHCSCPAGFLGKMCEAKDHCAPNPCHNGAECRNTDSGFQCSCTAGTKGEMCEEADHCLNEPCRNGGICLSTLASYDCLCRRSFTGQHCEIIDKPCSPNPCLNGGKCVTTMSGFRCECPHTHLGSLCEDPNLCLANPCKNNGRCIAEVKSFRCICGDSFKGYLCEGSSDDECDSCDPKALCIDKKCVCKEGYYGNGRMCRISKRCHPNPCLNAGVCNDDGVSFNCNCLNGFVGTRCEITNPCYFSPCRNNGKCHHDGNGNYSCLCDVHNTGRNCEWLSPCTPNPCHNGGTCLVQKSGPDIEDISTAYLCRCTGTAFGTNCEQHHCSNCDPMAYCKLGECICKEGFSGNGQFGHCKKITDAHEDRCAMCDSMASCKEGICTCFEGYFGTGMHGECMKAETSSHPALASPWSGGDLSFSHPLPVPRLVTSEIDMPACHLCNPHAVCVDKKCICMEGYSGSGLDCVKENPAAPLAPGPLLCPSFCANACTEDCPISCCSVLGVRRSMPKCHISCLLNCGFSCQPVCCQRNQQGNPLYPSLFGL